MDKAFTGSAEVGEIAIKERKGWSQTGRRGSRECQQKPWR